VKDTLFNFIFEVDTFIGNAKKNRTGDNTAKQNNNGLPANKCINLKNEIEQSVLHYILWTFQNLISLGAVVVVIVW
jgi:hypothetical protein